mgnify:CR=1 FL=1
MAAANSTRTRGIRFDRYWWGYFVTGDREALIEMGHVQAPLPGDPGENKWTMKAIDPQGRPINVARKSKRTFTIQRKWNPEEAAAFRVEEEKQKEREREIEDAKRRVGAWPVSADKYREAVRIAFDYGAGYVDNVFCSGKLGGYRYDAAAMDRAKFLLDQLRDLFETGTIVMDRALREESTPACIASTVRAADLAKQDKTFQRFMAGVNK